VQRTPRPGAALHKIGKNEYAGEQADHQRQKTQVAHMRHYHKLTPDRQAPDGQPDRTLLIQRDADART
jgi:hypothetical protein